MRLVDLSIPPITFAATLALCISENYRLFWAVVIAAGMAAISAVIPILAAMKEHKGPR